MSSWSKTSRSTTWTWWKWSHIISSSGIARSENEGLENLRFQAFSNIFPMCESLRWSPQAFKPSCYSKARHFAVNCHPVKRSRSQLPPRHSCPCPARNSHHNFRSSSAILGGDLPDFNEFNKSIGNETPQVGDFLVEQTPASGVYFWVDIILSALSMVRCA